MSSLCFFVSLLLHSWLAFFFFFLYSVIEVKLVFLAVTVD